MNQLTALLLTLALEVPVALLFGLRWGRRRGEGLERLLAVSVAASLITHPFAWHLLPALAGSMSWAGRVLLVEGGVAIVEGLLYAHFAGLGLVRGQVLGWVANSWSFGLGLVLFYFLPG